MLKWIINSNLLILQKMTFIQKLNRSTQKQLVRKMIFRQKHQSEPMILSGYLPNLYNDSKKSETYPSSLKNPDVTPIHKEKEKTLKKNYRPVKYTSNSF